MNVGDECLKFMKEDYWTTISKEDDTHRAREGKE
jgi:hypothetical protein